MHTSQGKPSTAFQRKVWAELTRIPRGQTRSYLDIAIAIGHPKSARAVANACGRNPFPILIPCHRAIKSDGSLGGYSAKGGAAKKQRLLLDEAGGYPAKSYCLASASV